MKIQDIKAFAVSKGIRASNKKKDELIRSIQLAEGNSDCFGTAKTIKCSEMNCLWRDDCLKIK